MTGTLDHSPGDILRVLLVDLSLGSTPPAPNVQASPWPVYSEGEPDSPDSVITVSTTTGRDEGREMVTGERQEHYGFQIRIRSAGQTAGYLKSDRIAKTLDQGVQNRTVAIGSARYLVHAVTRTGQVLGIGKESPVSKRRVFTINGLVALTQVA